MTLWTLVVNGVEKAFPDWGLAEDFAVDEVNKGKCSVRATSTEIFDAVTPQFAYKQPVKVYKDRVSTLGVFSGGTCVFLGYVADIERVNEEGRQVIRYTFYDIWWLLERQMFKQYRNQWAGWIGGDPANGPILNAVVCPEIYLGEKTDETLQTNGQQVTEILQWLNEVQNPTRRGNTLAHPGLVDATQDILTVGTIDLSAYIPVTHKNTIFCTDALVEVARWNPDAVFVRDWTTSPVTMKLRLMANLPEVVLTITAEQEKNIRVAPMNSRQLPGVIIYYKRVDTINGQPFPRLYVDMADAAGSGLYCNGTLISGPGGQAITDFTPEVSSHTIELRGGSATIVTANVEVEPITDLTTGSSSAQVAWWTKRDNSLGDPNIDPATIVVGTPTIKDNTGATVNLTTYPNELLSRSPVFDWMGVVWIEATVTCQVAYSVYADTAHHNLSAAVQMRDVHHRIILTNAVTKLYKGVSQLTAPEAVPVGLALSVFNSLAALQHSGTVTFVASPDADVVNVGTRLKLIGPNNTYTNLLVQRVNRVPHSQLIAIEFAPSSVLDAEQLLELIRATQRRLVYSMPSGRNSGSPSGGSNVDLSAAPTKENTMHGVGQFAQLFATDSAGGGNTAKVGMNATAQSFIMNQVDATGVPVPGAGSVQFRIADCTGTDVMIRACPAMVGGVLTTIYLATSAAPDLIGGGGSVWL